ncbi:MAG: lipooligosaccharide transport system permease protein [Chloroflexota bacterium]|jgi:lipooligosaccharide transport system permease protein|nr:lipooligosaccharide transport system permease protein [Chloroflexota bacterium]
MTLMTRVVELRAMQYRRTFRASLFSSFLNPVLFLAAMGVGLGTYVDRSGSASQALGGLSYLQFLAPGLLAATAMQAAAFESTFPIMSGLTWQKVFHAMYATPISARDIVVGNLTWIAIRLTSIAAIFTIVMTLFGAAASPLILLAIPAAVLTGMAFGAPIVAFSATQRTPEKFNAVFRFGITPLFLFSGTFFPVSNLPPLVQPIAWLSPLWHGVELSRQLALGTIGADPVRAVIHVAILAAIAVAGTFWAFRTVEARLVRG